MAKKLRQIACDPVCGFMVQSHDEKEVLKMAMEHAKKNHKEFKVTEAGLKKMMKLVYAPSRNGVERFACPGWLDVS